MDIFTQSALLEMHNKDSYFNKAYLQRFAKNCNDKDLQINNNSTILHNSAYRFILLSNFHDAIIKVQKQVVWGKEAICMYVTFSNATGIYTTTNKYQIDLLDAKMSATDTDNLDDIISEQRVFVLQCDCNKQAEKFCVALSCEYFVCSQAIERKFQIICTNIRVQSIE